ncbi:hypothetical protein BH23CHL5_BH23CHL5_05000 [soil metagenome]
MSATLSIVLVAAGTALVFLATWPDSWPQSRSGADPMHESLEPIENPARSGGNRLSGRLDILQRLRTDRSDLQQSVGRDYAAPELGDRI